MSISNVRRWHDIMLERKLDLLSDVLADDCVFWSPVVHTPQKGKALATSYLTAASVVLGNEHMRYVREFDCGARAVLEFETELEGIKINGVDMIEWNDADKIIDFKVMVRPLKAIGVVHRLMGEELMRMHPEWASKQS